MTKSQLKLYILMKKNELATNPLAEGHKRAYLT